MSMRNRIVWHFGHGLHASRRFSGRYEVIMWFTKSDDYTFNLDAVRVPQKYPQKKHFKGPRRGELSGNPLGKNPGDVWEIPCTIFWPIFGFEHEKLNQIISIIDIRNIGSQNVAKKNAMKINRQIKYHNLDVFIYQITLEEWNILSKK